MTHRPCSKALLFLLGVMCGTLVTGASALAQAQGPPESKLRFVLILTRHGVRSPTGSNNQLDQYSSQPWPKWDVPPGYLTPHGAKLMTFFGAYDRAYFVRQGLMSGSGCGDATLVSVYADSDQRTVETAKSLTQGMFPGCPPREQPQLHWLTENKADPLFHPLAAGLGKPDRERALDSIAGRIGEDPDGITEAYRPLLEQLQALLLGCVPASPCPAPGHTAAKPLLGIPATLDTGKGDHLAELKGPLNTAATITENFLLEYTNGLPMDQVGWGRLDLPTLMHFMELHTAASDLGRRTSYLATVQASSMLSHILDTMRQAASGKPSRGALGKVDDRVVVLVGHDTNIANVAAMLNINWLLDGRRDDTPPGGALVFELWQQPDSARYEVHTYYTAQTLEQMRNAVALNLAEPPARANIFIPDCSIGAPGFPCDWSAFQQTLIKVIDPAFTDDSRYGVRESK